MVTTKTEAYFIKKLKTLSRAKKVQLLSDYSGVYYGLEWEIKHYTGKTDTKKFQALKERYQRAKREKSNLENAFRKT